MIEHPTRQELRQKPTEVVKYLSVEATYANTDLGPLKIVEKSDAQWALRRKAKFSLAGYRNHNTYSPLTNTAANAARLAELSPAPVDPEPQCECSPFGHEPSCPTNPVTVEVVDSEPTPGV